MEIDDFKRKGPSIWSFMLMGILGAILGAFLNLSFAPGALYEGLSKEEETKAAAYTPSDSQPLSEDLSYAARSITPSLVWVAKMQGTGSSMKMLSSTTGFVVEASGYILTAYYASNNTDLYVFLKDDSSFKAQVVWNDKDKDLSILKISAPKLISAALGDPDKQAVGQMSASAEALWSGSREIRMSSGIISSKDRSMKIGQGVNLQNLIQSEASSGCISPEGAPLLNSSGEVIGVNIAAATDGKEQGFAIPINTIKPVIYSITMNGSFKEADLGIEGVDSEHANNYHMKVESGIVIKKLSPGGPAEAAGLKEGDTILSVAGSLVNTLSQLQQELNKIGAGNRAVMKVKFKDGTVDYAEAILGEKQ